MNAAEAAKIRELEACIAEYIQALELLDVQMEPFRRKIVEATASLKSAKQLADARGKRTTYISMTDRRTLLETATARQRDLASAKREEQYIHLLRNEMHPLLTERVQRLKQKQICEDEIKRIELAARDREWQQKREREKAEQAAITPPPSPVVFKPLPVVAPKARPIPLSSGSPYAKPLPRNTPRTLVEKLGALQVEEYKREERWRKSKTSE